MPKYNKLVRDKIPQIIENAGKEAVTRILESSVKRLKKSSRHRMRRNLPI